MKSRFATTSWTQVLKAREAQSSESRQALETLCKTYWYPLYAFVRRQGYGPEESRDLTQAYFAQLLEKDYLPRRLRSLSGTIPRLFDGFGEELLV